MALQKQSESANMVSANGKIIFLLLLTVLEIKSCKREDFKYIKIVQQPTAVENPSNKDVLKEFHLRQFRKYSLILPIEGSSDCDENIQEYEENLKNTHWVDLQGHFVKELQSGDVQNLNSLKFLLLCRNNIEVIQPGAFSNLPAIMTMKLENNKLKEIPSGVFNNLSAKYLYLSNNNIAHIAPDAFNNMQSLKEIELENNQLTKIPNSFGHLKSLEILKLARNRIEIVDDTTLTQLKELTLERNKFECIPDNVLASFSKDLKLKIAPNNDITCFCWNKIQQWQFNNDDADEKIVEATIRNSDLRCHMEILELLSNMKKKV